MILKRKVEDTFNDFYSKTPGCWIWQGTYTLNNSRKRYGSYRGKGAHRVSYERNKGPIPLGLQIDHLCRTTLCVNPDHLEAVTQKENIRRGVSITAINARRSTCKNGHPYESISVKERGCKICDKEQHAVYYQMNKERILERTKERYWEARNVK